MNSIFQRHIPALILIFTGVLASAGIAAGDELDDLNIVFLLTDDQATISMGCYGNQDVQTPNLDRLAAAGMVFDNHYVTTAICMASRASIMTGLYEYRTGCNFTRGKMIEKRLFERVLL